MTNEQIRERLMAEGRGILGYFENTVGEVKFYGNKTDGYFMYPASKDSFYENLLTTMPTYDMNGLLLFMQGVCQSERVRRCFNEEGK